MEVVEDARPDDLGGVVAEAALERRAREPDGRVLLDEEDQVRGVLDDGEVERVLPPEPRRRDTCC
jgi:hypothetical protein